VVTLYAYFGLILQKFYPDILSCGEPQEIELATSLQALETKLQVVVLELQRQKGNL
ncbi:hypothetical protein Cfor_09318, partial [Coptotermes formosanus]